LPTLRNNIYAESLSLKSSDLVLDKKIIYFSNNKNEFYALEANSGILRWKTKINSVIRPKIIGNAIITITQNGFLIILDKVSGNIIRITDIFDKFKEKKRVQIYPVGFVVGAKKIYLTTTNGRLLIIDIKTGKNEKIMKIDGDKISKPFINKNKLFIIKDKAIIRFN
jgi:outer membrane protein assembly factor BamB